MRCETDMLQDKNELDQLIKLIQMHGVKSYLEIGGKFGGSLWHIGNALPKGSRIVSVDLPHHYGVPHKETRPHLEQCIDALKKRGYDTHLILRDSTDPVTVKLVCKLGPFDLIFIDGNHLEQYVRKDWANYGPLGKMVAFHDIAWRFMPHKDTFKNGKPRMPIHVPIVWNEIKNHYKFLEISYHKADNGIGVLWR